MGSYFVGFIDAHWPFQCMVLYLCKRFPLIFFSWWCCPLLCVYQRWPLNCSVVNVGHSCIYIRYDQFHVMGTRWPKDIERISNVNTVRLISGWEYHFLDLFLKEANDVCRPESMGLDMVSNLRYGKVIRSSMCRPYRPRKNIKLVKLRTSASNRMCVMDGKVLLYY